MPRAQVWSRPVGEDGTFTHDIRDSSGNVIGATAYSGAEVLTPQLWQGGQLAPIAGVLTSSWHSPFDGTVDTKVSGPGTAALLPGFFRVEVKVTKSGTTMPIHQGWLELTATPGVAAVGPVYATFADVIEYGGDWVKDLVTSFGETNFQQELERARTWLDQAIVAKFRALSYRFGPQYWVNMGTWPWGPSDAPDRTITGYLAANYLIVKPITREIAAHKALAIVCEKKIDFDEAGERYTKRARFHSNKANTLLATYRAEFDINNDGFTDLAFNMGVFSFR